MKSKTSLFFEKIICEKILYRKTQFFLDNVDEDNSGYSNSK